MDEGAAAALLDRLAGGGEGVPGGADGPGRRPPGLPGITGGLDRSSAPSCSGRRPGTRASSPGSPAASPRTSWPGAPRCPVRCPAPRGSWPRTADRLDGLPAHTRALLLLAAAAQEHEPAGAGADALLLLSAGTRTGLPRDFLDGVLFGSAATEGFLQRAGSRVHFSHPLFAARSCTTPRPPDRRHPRAAGRPAGGDRRPGRRVGAGARPPSLAGHSRRALR
ncbi:hypothetical protein LUR56_10635 [Streptomyces sp. MT29]|nr:hypothetical protein [Streptomyces sp. MT29]